MSKQKDRDEFISIMAQEGVPFDVARKFMRASGTLQRLAEWECNGYGWEDHWKRIPCPNAKDLGSTDCELCGRVAANPGATHYETTKGALYLVREDKRLRALVARYCAPYGIKPIFEGDPRGAVLKLAMPSGRTNDFAKEGVCVP